MVEVRGQITDEDKLEIASVDPRVFQRKEVAAGQPYRGQLGEVSGPVAELV